MGHVKGVIRALVADGKARNAAVLANGWETVAATSQNLVAISLVAHVPDDLVAWRVEGVMERQRQLDRAQTGGEVAADLGDHADEIVSQFFRHDGQCRARHLLEVGRRIDVGQVLVIHQDFLAIKK